MSPKILKLFKNKSIKPKRKNNNLILKKLMLKQKRDKWFNLKMESSTKDNGQDLIDIDMVFKYGLMEPNIKEIGKKTRHVERENLFMQMAIIMKVSGKMIKLMDLVHMSILKLEHVTKVIGKTI